MRPRLGMCEGKELYERTYTQYFKYSDDSQRNTISLSSQTVPLDGNLTEK